MIGGLDVGRHRDRTALCRLTWPTVASLHEARRPARLKEQADELDPLLRPCRLIAVDASGLGLGLAEELEDRGLPIVAVTITGASAVNRTASGVTAGKLWLMQRIRVAIHAGLRVPPDLPSAGTLREQMANMLPKRQRRTYKVEAGGGHDDLVLALALALLGMDLHGAQQTGHGREPGRRDQA